MNLSQALKQKNRMAGELVRLNQIFHRENSRRNDNPSKVDCQEVWEKIVKLSDELGELKAKIAAANVPIYSKIERMAELKSRISFLQSLPKREGQESSFLGGDKVQTYNWSSFLNQEICDLKVSEIQDAINNLQDEIDSFNHSTQIMFLVNGLEVDVKL